jgi:acetoin utilization deacetylase AcuC-like enzyme
MLKTVYSPAMVAFKSEYPGPSKAAAVVERAMIELGLEIIPPGPITDDTLALAHSPSYIHRVTVGQATNGFGNHDPAIPPQAKTCVAAMITATQLAIGGNTIVCVPASGFHHASYESGWGFCTFNGLMVPIRKELLARPNKHVLIIDGDAHFGDGTEDIIQLLGLQYAQWRSEIAGVLNERDWDLVYYQAGADAHKDDSYGAGYLDDDDWYERDRGVFSACASRRIPTVFNFAGGYNGKKTQDLHFRTMLSAAQQLAIHQPSGAVLEAARDV